MPGQNQQYNALVTILYDWLENYVLRNGFMNTIRRFGFITKRQQLRFASRCRGGAGEDGASLARTIEESIFTSHDKK